MNKLIIQIIGSVYNRLPTQLRPVIKKTASWLILWIQSAVLGRRVYKGTQIKFLDFEIAYLDRIEFLGPNHEEVLVEVFYSIVSPGTETAVLRGLPGARRNFPYCPGYSAAGRVVKVGKRVNRLKVGDFVAGRVPHCSSASVDAAMLFKIPDGVSPVEASFIELGIIVLQGIRKAKIRPGDKVAVVGQGLIGQIANRLVRVVGATPVIALASSRKREKTALLPGGADEFIAFGEPGADLGGLQADVVIEAVGVPDVVTMSMRCARDGGRVVLLGSARGLGRGVELFTLAQSRDIEIVGAHISAMPEKDCSARRWTYRQEGELFLKLLQQKRLRVKDLVTWHVAPDECNAVYENLCKKGGTHVGILFNWHPYCGEHDRPPRNMELIHK